MRRGDGTGHLRDQLQPLRKIDILDPALSRGPFEQIPPFGIIAFKEERRIVELGSAQRRDVRTLAKHFAQQSEQRQFALERAQPLGIETELENASLAQLEV